MKILLIALIFALAGCTGYVQDRGSYPSGGAGSDGGGGGGGGYFEQGGHRSSGFCLPGQAGNC